MKYIPRAGGSNLPKDRGRHSASGRFAAGLAQICAAESDACAFALLSWYIGTMSQDGQLSIERVQTGVRIEKRLLKVLKAFAEYRDLTLGDLLEGIVLHAFDGKAPFSRESLDTDQGSEEVLRPGVGLARQPSPEGKDWRADFEQARLLILHFRFNSMPGFGLYDGPGTEWINSSAGRFRASAFIIGSTSGWRFLYLSVYPGS